MDGDGKTSFCLFMQLQVWICLETSLAVISSYADYILYLLIFPQFACLTQLPLRIQAHYVIAVSTVFINLLLSLSPWWWSSTSGGNYFEMTSIRLCSYNACVAGSVDDVMWCAHGICRLSSTVITAFTDLWWSHVDGWMKSIA